MQRGHIMDMNLKSYVKIYSNWIEEDKRKTILSDLTTVNWEQHTYYQPKTAKQVAISGENELNVTSDLLPDTPYVMQRIWDAYYQYLVKDFNFPWYNGWAGYAAVRFNRYCKNQLMAPHCDHIVTLFEGDRRGIPVLTALGILNDDFEGGEFVMWEEDLKLKSGDIVIFPSIFLYPHKVNPVIKGERYSFVSWAW